MSVYEKTFAALAPEMNPTHCESLALGLHRTLNGLPIAAFEDIAALARRLGPAKLAEFHAGMCP